MNIKEKDSAIERIIKPFIYFWGREPAASVLSPCTQSLSVAI